MVSICMLAHSLLIGGGQLFFHSCADGFYEQVLVEEANLLLGGMKIYIDMVSWEPQILDKQCKSEPLLARRVYRGS